MCEPTIEGIFKIMYSVQCLSCYW